MWGFLDLFHMYASERNPVNIPYRRTTEYRLQPAQMWNAFSHETQTFATNTARGYGVVCAPVIEAIAHHPSKVVQAGPFGRRLHCRPRMHWIMLEWTLAIICLISCFFSITTALWMCFCREGSVVAHFWIVLSVPVSHVGGVTLKKVTSSLEQGLRQGNGSKQGETAMWDGYLFHIPSLSVSGKTKRGGRDRERRWTWQKCVERLKEVSPGGLIYLNLFFSSVPYRNWLQSNKTFESFIWYPFIFI